MLFLLGKTANLVIYWCLLSNQLPKRFIHEIQSAGFAAMHSRAVTCFVFSVEREKLAVTKIMPRRFKMCVEVSLLKGIRDSLSTLICRKCEVKLCKSLWNKSSRSVDGPARLLQFRQGKDCKAFISQPSQECLLGIFLCDIIKRWLLEDISQLRLVLYQVPFLSNQATPSGISLQRVEFFFRAILFLFFFLSENLTSERCFSTVAAG